MSRQKHKGTRFETEICRYLRAALDDDRIERRALHGTMDMGDIYGLYSHGFSGIIEAKAYADLPNRRLLEEWRNQTLNERDNADADFAFLVIKYPRHSVGDSIVHVTIRDLCIFGRLELIEPALPRDGDAYWVSMTLEEAVRLMVES